MVSRPIIGFAALLVSSHALGASFMTLGTLPGGNGDAYATAISADGSTVVGYGGGTNGGAEVFRWTLAGGMEVLGELPGGQVSAFPFGVSGDGSVVVGLSNSGTTSSGDGTEAFVWTEGNGMVAAGEPATGGDGFAVVLAGVSHDGNVVAGMRVELGVGSSLFHRDLAASKPSDVSDSGQLIRSCLSYDGSTVVGQASGSAFRWTTSGGLEIIGPGNASVVSADGTVVGGSIPGGKGYVWSDVTGVELLGDFEGRDAAPSGMSGDGKAIAGTGSLQFGENIALRWTREEGWRRIDEILETDFGILIDDGFRLRETTGISADGKTIVGFGNYPSIPGGGNIPWMATLSPTLGDANGDGIVTPADYTIWADNFGSGPGATILDGDFNLDGFVNGADYTVWSDNYTGLPGAPTAVPEPSSIALAFALLPIACLAWKNKGQPERPLALGG